MNSYLDIKPEVADALAKGQPVVALESTIISHGMPWPDNATTAKEVEQIIRDAGSRASTDAPLAWLRFEADGETPGAAISLILWPGGETRSLGRADFHGRWLDWRGSTSAAAQ